MSYLAQEKAKREKQDRVEAIALGDAITWSVGATLVAGGLTALATLRSKKFSQFMSVSAKTSIPVMAGLGMFAFRYELTQHNVLNYPERYNEFGVKNDLTAGPVSKIPFHHKAMNYLYDHPFYFVSAVGFPFAGAILAQNMKLKHLTFSQKVMHSRVMAQGGVLVILLTTMAFTGWMDRRGRFPEPDAAPVSSEEVVDYTAGNLHRGSKKQ